MIFSRRLFLGGSVGLVAASFVKTSTSVPVLYGDLIHDDAPALNALFRGDPVRVLSGRALEGERPSLLDAKCLLGSPVIIRARQSLIHKCHFEAAEGFEGRTIFELASGADDVELSNIAFDVQNIRLPGYAVYHHA